MATDKRKMNLFFGVLDVTAKVLIIFSFSKNHEILFQKVKMYPMLLILVPSLNSIEIDLVFQFIDNFHRNFLCRLSF